MPDIVFMDVCYYDSNGDVVARGENAMAWLWTGGIACAERKKNGNAVRLVIRNIETEDIIWDEEIDRTQIVETNGFLGSVVWGLREGASNAD